MFPHFVAIRGRSVAPVLGRGHGQRSDATHRCADGGRYAERADSVHAGGAGHLSVDEEAKRRSNPVLTLQDKRGGREHARPLPATWR